MLCPRLLLLALAMIVLFSWRPLAVHAGEEMTERARKFIKDHEARLHALDVAANRAWWDANTSGKAEDFARKIETQNRIDEALGNRTVFAELKTLKENRKQIDDPILARVIDVLYLLYLEKQVDAELLKKMVAKANAIEEQFNNFRAKVDGREMTDNEVRNVLKTSTDSARLEAVWSASKAVGAEVAAGLKELVRLRNQAAVQLGFKNFHAMQLYLNEQDGEQLIRLFDELDELTRAPFAAAKADLDARLAKRDRLQTTDLRPWHYHDPFFQATPDVFATDLDAPFAKADLLSMCRTFYAGIGLPIDRVIAKSDLYEKKGKSQHAFCTDIDREGDVRVLANIRPNNQWASTLLHEFGHSVYSSLYIPASLPYPVRWERTS